MLGRGGQAGMTLSALAGRPKPTLHIPLLMFVSQCPGALTLPVPSRLPSVLCRCRLSKEKEQDGKVWTLSHRCFWRPPQRGCQGPRQALTMMDLGHAS